MMLGLLVFALNKQICLQKEEAGLHKGDVRSHKTDHHPR